jgi:hypothetical protein
VVPETGCGLAAPWFGNVPFAGAERLLLSSAVDAQFAAAREHLEEVDCKIADLEALRHELRDLVGQRRHGTIDECCIVHALSQKAKEAQR